MKDLNFIEGYCEGLAYSSEEKAYEVAHMERVVKNAKRLAFQRGLNPFLVSFIAHTHDVGRLKMSVVGKQHSKIGARHIKKEIESYDLSELQKKTIVRAIKRHNKKDQIHDAYDEVIKDADSLAHLEDFGFEKLNVYERKRIIASEVGFVECRVSEHELWTDCILNQMKRLHLQWQVEAFDENPNEWVHSVRIAIRKTRSLMDLINAVAPSEALNAYSLYMKSIFSQLSDARMFFVMSVYQSKQKQFEGKKSLENKLKKSLSKVRHLIECTDSETLVFQGLNEMSYDLRDEVLKAFTTYFEACKEKVESIEALHRLRVKGKFFKYACEHELVTFNAVSISKGINDLHDAIGTAHDFYEMLRFKHAKRYFSQDALERDYKKALNNCKAQLFYFKLISRTHKGDV